ncbi:hypothetical protein ACTFIY_002005 [Dictyostelium cf. discoideum]
MELLLENIKNITKPTYKTYFGIVTKYKFASYCGKGNLLTITPTNENRVNLLKNYWQNLLDNHQFLNNNFIETGIFNILLINKDSFESEGRLQQIQFYTLVDPIICSKCNKNVPSACCKNGVCKYCAGKDIVTASKILTSSSKKRFGDSTITPNQIQEHIHLLNGTCESTFFKVDKWTMDRTWPELRARNWVGYDEDSRLEALIFQTSDVRRRVIFQEEIANYEFTPSLVDESIELKNECEDLTLLLNERRLILNQNPILMPQIIDLTSICKNETIKYKAMSNSKKKSPIKLRNQLTIIKKYTDSSMEKINTIKINDSIVSEIEVFK